MEFLKIQDEINYSAKRYELKREIEDMFLEEGFIQIEPSVFEDIDQFISVNKRIKKESIVKVVNGNSKILILRPDITMNIIKSLIPRWSNNLKLKLFYNSTVFKNKADSNIKEIRQMGVEYLGEDSLKADGEVIRMALSVLKKYNDNFILEIGNSKYINRLFNQLHLKDEVEKELKNLIYKKNRFELINYIKKLSIDNEICELLLNVLDFQGNIREIVTKAEDYYMNDEMKNALYELKELNDFIEKVGYLKNIHFDLSMITELDYYEGLIFKGYYKESYVDIISGGRYDSLTENFGKKVSAVGFSMDLDQLMKIYKGKVRTWNI